MDNFSKYVTIAWTWNFILRNPLCIVISAAFSRESLTVKIRKLYSLIGTIKIMESQIGLSWKGP